ncbi:MAG: polyamine ABC transporter ATP-binding protein [Alphaproteobacteria bacterium]|nr:polyamine ABC transporter ATP-binding protein [Alphaproteobacteria bacterium]OJV46946.1 MAG: ABC transporter ATP-binding protein [Alphaproteobacteria bacterium 43-37]
MPPSTPLSRLEPWQDPKARPYIQIDHVSKSYEGFPALNNFSLSIYKKEFFCLLGGSGCGKTTLLRVLAGFETPTSGHVWIDGINMEDKAPYERPVNMMFQSYALFPHMSVEQNVAFGLKQEPVSKAERKSRVESVLELVQMQSYAKRKPHQLSGGQRQRVALARSLVKQPKLLLLDEPLAALDKTLRERTQFELVNIQERVGITFIMVTHDQEEAMTMATRIGVMEAGRLRQVGTPNEIYEYPNSMMVANFIGSINIFEGFVTEDQADHVLIRSSDLGCDLLINHSSAAPVGAHVHVAIRPEKIAISKTPLEQDYNWAKGKVRDIGYLGDVSIFHIVLKSGKIVLATVPNLVRVAERPVTWEDEVYLCWRPENGIVLTS